MRYVGIVNDSELLSRRERLKPTSAKLQASRFEFRPVGKNREHPRPSNPHDSLAGGALVLGRSQLLQTKRANCQPGTRNLKLETKNCERAGGTIND
jgi:hypothetical protein